ncbi:hypothetical protein [Candidatus Electronema sp. JM]|uniref:hypothetical protein n=1 Tax=Candidatus Electronema sp. JM TaxID=3401571 RepID=UPI003AA87082
MSAQTSIVNAELATEQRTAKAAFKSILDSVPAKPPLLGDELPEKMNDEKAAQT